MFDFNECLLGQQLSRTSQCKKTCSAIVFLSCFQWFFSAKSARASVRGSVVVVLQQRHTKEIHCVPKVRVVSGNCFVGSFSCQEVIMGHNKFVGVTGTTMDLLTAKIGIVFT